MCITTIYAGRNPSIAMTHSFKLQSLFKQKKGANHLKLVQTTVHAVREVWDSALRRSIPEWLAMKTKQGNGSRFGIFFSEISFLWEILNYQAKKNPTLA